MAPLWFRWQGWVDFAVLAVALYFLFRWAREIRALRVVFTILGLQALARVTRQFDLAITGWVLDIATILLVLMLLFFFQPELRRTFLKLDALLRLGLRPRQALESGYRAIAEAAFSMAAEKVGALMVVARRDSLRESGSGGVAVGAEISPEVLTTIFGKNSPVHDGAVIIEANRIARVAVVLPLTQRFDVPFQFGTRHRAAMGITERSDALVIVVSEERGEVTLMHGREITSVGGADELVGLMEKLTAGPSAGLLARIGGWLFHDLRYKFAAGGLAALLWGMSIVGTGTTVRLVSVPVEFAGVPAGMEIVSQSASTLQVQLRGTPWLLGSVGLTGMVARFSLSNPQAGQVVLRVTSDNLNLPPGVVIERVRPEAVTLLLARRLH
jgi:diadenylate cyclase